jgi:putative selenate reductase
MSNQMKPVPFKNLLEWTIREFIQAQTIFGIPCQQFYFSQIEQTPLRIFGESLDNPLGPAAGPHTQLAQNIVAAYLVGGRFMELKTVQKLDKLKIDKPCIDAEDEGYNVEWSQELRLGQSFEEYVKAWFLIHFLRSFFNLSQQEEKGFVFNMSVGYDLAGIQTEPMDWFIESLKNAGQTDIFHHCLESLLEGLDKDLLSRLLKKRNECLPGKGPDDLDAIISTFEHISPLISHSVTLSTMHGCPPQEIEAICNYLLEEKGLHTYVKLNPTLLGYNIVESMLFALGYNYIRLERKSFDHDLQFQDAVPMLERLKTFAKLQEREFGVKLSNTLGTLNQMKVLAGDQMYLSGRALFPLTVNLAAKLSRAMEGQLKISYSGGATAHNVLPLLESGIYPVTLVTDLLKPGGYLRLRQMAERIESLLMDGSPDRNAINPEKLRLLAQSAMDDFRYQKKSREIKSIKIDQKLPLFDCYLAPCQVACPIHQDVPEYIRLVEEGRFEEAFDVVTRKNPLPHITGYICDHQCMAHCTRWDYEEPVQIREVKKVAAENGFFVPAAGSEQNENKSGSSCRVAVIGAGPAGLSAAFFLARNGIDVTIFERRQYAGGTVQHVIPDFRLPQSAIDHDIEFLKAHGVKFEFGYEKEFSITELKSQGFKYIFLGIGAGRSNKLKISGDSEKIIDAIDFLWDFHVDKNIKPGERVAVIGGGNSAMDGARAAHRCPGVEKVYIIYRRTKEFMPADKEEFDAALQDRIIFREMLLPVEYRSNILKCQKMKLAEPDVDGRRKVIQVEGKFEEFEVDMVISAVGERVDTGILQKNGISLSSTGKVIVSAQTLETEIENVFIGGDALRGPSTVVESIADGKKVAEVILEREKIALISGNDLSGFFDRQKRLQDALQRRGLIIETDNADAQNEASRCLACNLLCNKCVDVCPNRANVAIWIKSPGQGFKDIYQILHLDALCNECGNCETFCPYQGSPYRDKMTLFQNEDDFRNSTNSGFYLKSKGNDGSSVFAVRLSDVIGELVLDGKGQVVQSDFRDKQSSRASENFNTLLSTVHRDYSYLFFPSKTYS